MEVGGWNFGRSFIRNLRFILLSLKEFLSYMESHRQRGHRMFKNMRRKHLQVGPNIFFFSTNVYILLHYSRIFSDYKPHLFFVFSPLAVNLAVYKEVWPFCEIFYPHQGALSCKQNRQPGNR